MNQRLKVFTCVILAGTYYTVAVLSDHIAVRMYFYALLGVSTIGATVIDLQCDHDQIVCPLQKIIYHCVVEGTEQTLVWKLESHTVAHVDSNGTIILSSTNSDIMATAMIQDNTISSTLSFTAQFQYNLLRTGCFDNGANSLNCSYAFVGTRIYCSVIYTS